VSTLGNPLISMTHCFSIECCRPTKTHIGHLYDLYFLSPCCRPNFCLAILFRCFLSSFYIRTYYGALFLSVFTLYLIFVSLSSTKRFDIWKQFRQKETQLLVRIAKPKRATDARGPIVLPHVSSSPLTCGKRFLPRDAL